MKLSFTKTERDIIEKEALLTMEDKEKETAEPKSIRKIEHHEDNAS